MVVRVAHTPPQHGPVHARQQRDRQRGREGAAVARSGAAAQGAGGPTPPTSHLPPPTSHLPPPRRSLFAVTSACAHVVGALAASQGCGLPCDEVGGKQWAESSGRKAVGGAQREPSVAGDVGSM